MGTRELLVGFEQEKSKEAMWAQPCFRKIHVVPQIFVCQPELKEQMSDGDVSS